MNIPADTLQDWAAAVFQRCGVTQDDAVITARQLVRTSLRGIDTHGIARVPSYVESIEAGIFNARAHPRMSERHGTLHCEGEAGIGQVVIATALEAAMDRCRAQAMVTCTIEDCGHLGALGTPLLEAVERGFVAFLCQRTPPIVSLEGFQGRAIGNNPLAFAMPVAGAVPLVFDMALSKVARGHVLAAQRDATAIPEGWAVDPEGHPTTDAAAALRGAMLPMSGHKGMGLAMLVQCLAGSLAGATAQARALKSSPGSIGAFLFMANPQLLAGREAFDANVRDWLGVYLKSAGANGRYPGQRQAHTEQERLRTGIPMPLALLDELWAVGRKQGVAL